MPEACVLTVAIYYRFVRDHIHVCISLHAMYAGISGRIRDVESSMCLVVWCSMR